MISCPWALVALAIGFGLIGYGLSPLAGSGFGQGLSERGCLAAILGIAIVSGVTIFKVAS